MGLKALPEQSPPIGRHAQIATAARAHVRGEEVALWVRSFAARRITWGTVVRGTVRSAFAGTGGAEEPRAAR